MRKSLFFGRQRSKKGEAPHTISCDSVLVDVRRPPRQLPKVVPVEITPVFKLLDQGRRIERVAGLPEFDDNHAANQSSIERPGCEHAKVVNVAGLVALVAGADFLGKDLIESQASDFTRHEREELEIALLLLPDKLGRQGGRFASADLQLYLTVPTRFQSWAYVGFTPHESVSCVS